MTSLREEDRTEGLDRLRQYAALVRRAPIGVLTYGRDLVIREANPALCRILRTPEDVLVGLDMNRLQDRRILPCLRGAVAGRETIYEGPYDATNSTARVFILMKAVPIHGPAATENLAMAIVEDITERKRADGIREMLFELSESVHASADLGGLFRAIHGILSRRMPADNLYIALWDESSRTIRFPYFVDRYDTRPPPQKARRGLTERVLFDGQPLLADRCALEELRESGQVEIGGSLPASWLGVPLVVANDAVGVLVLQSYDDEVIFTDEDASILGFVAEQVAMAIVRKGHEEEIHHLASYDSLTGLRNRRMLRETAPEALALARRQEWNAALLYLDLDRFKTVNDTLGHDAGDELLVEVAREISAARREEDFVARIGGDEFAFLVQNASMRSAVQTSMRILRVFDQRFEVRGHPVHLGGSIGIAIYPDHGETLDELLKNADIAMYRAKREQSGWSIYDEASSPWSRQRLAREAALREAIESDGIDVEYQPIRSLRTGRVVALEALARWSLEGHSQSPNDFVPLAEECGTVHRLDLRVLDRALRDVERRADLTVSVNVSPRTLRSPDFLVSVRAALERRTLDPGRLIVEITESSILQSFERPSRILAELRDLGVSVAVDDFGSGYASLSYLLRLPCDRLKIDAGLIAEIGRDRRTEALVRSIVSLGRGLDLRVVAEGVETHEQLEWLDDAGVHDVQGFLTGRPATFEALERSGALDVGG